MKRKTNPNKVWEFIGKVIVYSLIYVGLVAGCVWAFMQNTVY